MRIAAYCRVSTDKEEQLDSLTHQKEFFLQYAAKNGHELVRLYADEGISGTSLKKRMEFQHLMRDASLGLFQMVVVKDVSRFARNTVDFLQSIRKLKALGINTLFLTANMESLGESEFILTVFSALAQEESINLSKRVKFGKRINAQKGRVPPIVFGYDREDNFSLKINPIEAAIVKEIFSLYLSGMGCRAISHTLNLMGYKTKYCCDWNPRGVRRVLSNPIYCGEYVNNKYEIKDCLDGKLVRLPEEQHIHHKRPEWAIVTKEVYLSAQRILKERNSQYSSENHSRRARFSDRHIFSSLITCEHCGRSFTRKSYTYKKTRVFWKCPTNDQYTAERCDNRITIDEPLLIKAIHEYIERFICSASAVVTSVIVELDKRRDSLSKTDHHMATEAKIQKINSMKAKYQDLYIADLLSLEELKKKTSALNENLSMLESQLKKSSEGEHRIETEKALHRAIEEFLQFKNINNIDLKNLIKRITINQKGRVQIYFQSFSERSLCMPING